MKKLYFLFATIVFGTIAGFAQSVFPPASVEYGTYLGETIPLRDFETIDPINSLDDVRIIPNNLRQPAKVNPDALPLNGDPLVGLNDPFRAPAETLVNFEGTNISEGGAIPPDPSGAVGPNHYVQMVNSAFAIYDKSGNQIQGPIQINQLWQGSEHTICANNNAGDPIVLYDHLADRWLLSQFAPLRYHSICIAISQSADPTGSYYTYQFDVQLFPDYFKFGVWDDAYYMSANEGGNTGYTAYAFDRAKMLAGEAASFQKVDGQKNFLLPSDLDGSTEPPANSPNYFYTFKDNLFSAHESNADVLEVWAFDVDWNNSNNTTFTRMTAIPIASFTYSVCGHFNFNCIPQKETGQEIDSVSEWPMWRAQYRNFGTHETLVGNFTVDVGNNLAGIRWFELRKSGNGNWQLHQEGTHAPDSNHRWMGSIAMDQSGNMALGYSISGTNLNPGIRYTTRLATDPEGTLSEEEVLQAGTISQSNSNRWGDYSSLNVDPADDCTFWYTNEYISASTRRWKTRIGTFKISSCGQKSATPTPTATPLQAAIRGFLLSKSRKVRRPPPSR